MPRQTGEAYPSVIAIKRLEVDMHLGVGEEERSVLQKVAIHMRLYLPHTPPAAKSDSADYICYGALSEKIHALCGSREYRLIEHLTHAIYEAVRPLIRQDIKLWIKLHKIRIPLPYVKDGTSYSYTDIPPFSWVIPE